MIGVEGKEGEVRVRERREMRMWEGKGRGEKKQRLNAVIKTERKEEI